MTDALDAIEQAGQAARAARKAARATPAARVKRHSGRAQKARGYRAEKRIERLLAAFGYWRVPMSGALGGRLSGDLRRDPTCAVQVIECKHRDRGWPVLRRHLGQGGAHALVLEEGERAEPLFVLTASTMTALLREAGYDA